jgi:RimJ/RimL family protein N-acetyltransferase
MNGRYNVYCEDSTRIAVAEPPLGSAFECWRPSLARIFPPPTRDPALVAFWALHQARGFPISAYSAIIARIGGHVVHRSMVYPRYFAFPFMGPNDLQIGNTSTSPEFRGQGLAVAAIAAASTFFGSVGRRIWYVASVENTTSCRVAERAGLRLVGSAVHHSRFGLRQLGGYSLVAPISD